MAALTLRSASYTATSKVASGLSGSTTITVSPDAVGIVIGHRVTGSGIGAGAVVQSITYSTNTVALSVANSGTVSGSVNFTESTKGSPLTNLEIDANFTELRRDIASKASSENVTLTNVAISNGAINGTSIGATTRSSGAFTTLAANGAVTLTAGTASTSTTTGSLVVTGGAGFSGNVYASAFYGSGANLVGIPNSALNNSVITISGTAVPLGGSIEVLTAANIGGSVQAYSATLDTVTAGSYAGSTSITTLGTIATGSWNASTITVAKGGTGATTPAGARESLGLVIGTNVQGYSLTLDTVTAGSYVGTTSITTLGIITSGSWNASVIGATYGGTGFSSYTVGDLLAANTTTNLSKIVAVATGNVLLSGGIATLPSWGKVGLTSHVSGTLPIANGGTGATDATTARSNLGLVIGTNVQGYSATLAAVAGGTYAGAASITTLGTITTGTWNGVTIAVANGGTGATTASAARTNLGLGTAATMTGPTGTIVGTTDTQTLTNKTIGLGGTLDANNNNITEIKTATFNSQVVLNTTTGSVAIDWSAAQNYKQNEPTGSITYTFTAPAGPCHLQLLIDSDGTSAAQTFTWPATVVWLGFTFSHVANKKMMVNFWFDGTNYYAMFSTQV